LFIDRPSIRPASVRKTPAEPVVADDRLQL
jgi:hypothetical protein